MTVFIANDRKVKVGDTVTLTGGRWYTDDHTFKVGDTLTIVEDKEETEFYMTVSDNVFTVEISGVKSYPNDFE